MPTTFYKKFTQPLIEAEADLLNEAKDYALSILLSEKEAIDEYHSNQIKRLKSK